MPACAETIQAAATLCRFCKYDFRAGAPRRAAPPPLPAKGGGMGVVVIIVIVLVIGVIGIVAVVAAIAIPGLLSAQRASNERNASASLKTLSSAEADFRSNDRDGDRTNNFWVRDAYSLFALCPSEDGTTAPKPESHNMIKLIEPSMACADVTGTEPPSGAVGASTAIGAWTAKANYVYRALESYEAKGGSEKYGAKDAGAIKAYGNSWNFGKFAFVAMPVNRAGGRRLFLMTEDFTIYAGDVGSSYSATYTGGSGKTASFSWSDADVGGREFTAASPCPAEPYRSGWSKLD
jgi:hypothetical protein